MDDSSSPDLETASVVPPPLHALAGNAKCWALFLDFDGTLVDLAPSPDKIEVPHELPQLLKRLSDRFAGALAIFTGRSLSDLDRHLGLSFPAAGQHGAQRRMEIGMAPREASVPALEMARERMHELAAAWPRLLVEDKGATLAVHYRAVPDAGARVHALLREIVAASGSELEIQEGKYVYELRPAGIDKGAALDAFLQVPPFSGRLPLVVGDDVTDETAFAVALRAGGAAVKVGAGESRAAWRLDTPRSVRSWLENGVEHDE